ncbi:MAG: M14 family zinc carboxypeptidase, partial [Gemmatimonadota bacterium]
MRLHARRPALSLAAIVLAATLTPALSAQQAAPARAPFTATLAPGVRYDPAIPTLEAVVGHDFDEALTTPEQIAAYMHALANAAPDRTRLVVYGHTYEGRELDLLVIGSAERMARLDSIKAGLHRLAYPEGLDDAAANRLMAALPVVVAALHEVHGNEISGAGAGMAEAYHLLAAQNDPRVTKILAQELVLIDPLQNPDGRGRFVEGYKQARSFPADPDPASAGHDEPWPGGRTNHYLFDLNRDWFALTQPESRGKVRALLEYQPQVVADLHEMGGNSTYYFPPAAIPGNPWVTQQQWHWYDVLGRAMANAFDARGFAYFTREEFDAFYPGYGVSWPTAQGAMGMTFEQASARGLVVRRSDGTLLTYGDGILHHFTAALATMVTAADNRQQILRDFLDFHRSAMQIARNGGPAAWVLHSDRDPAMA